MASPNLTTYKVIFSTLGCLMLASLVYTIVTDGSPFRKELLTPWLTATLIDFYVNVVAISVWVAYKESTWLNAIIWVILLICFGSIATCAYVVLKLFSISSQDVQDPVSRVLLRGHYEPKMKCSSVVLSRILFSVLGIFVSGVVIYTIVTDGLPFRIELLTPWMAATLIDFYINVFAILVWVVHKESMRIGAFIWVCLLICLGSIATCTYIVIQLFQISTEDPMYSILLDSHSKDERLDERSYSPKNK